ncbi:MAG: membrane integrity-associated transporter subunit PqiC, partial [Gammaproteobacteria bacterium]|nr:membrane integrity-associated transporter subunit PqiC [Gammaproteobacteria bacterium]
MSLAISMMMMASCSMFSPIKMSAPTTYLLTDLPSTSIKKHSAINLLVLQPEALPAYNTTSMAYSIKPYQIAYFAKNRWAETPAQMLYPLIVQALQNTHHFHAIVTPPYTGRFDYILRIQLLQLLQDFSSQPILLRLKVRAQLSRVATNRVIATKVFLIEEPILKE